MRYPDQTKTLALMMTVFALSAMPASAQSHRDGEPEVKWADPIDIDRAKKAAAAAARRDAEQRESDALMEDVSPDEIARLLVSNGWVLDPQPEAGPEAKEMRVLHRGSDLNPSEYTVVVPKEAAIGRQLVYKSFATESGEKFSVQKVSLRGRHLVVEFNGTRGEQHQYLDVRKPNGRSGFDLDGYVTGQGARAFTDAEAFDRAVKEFFRLETHAAKAVIAVADGKKYTVDGARSRDGFLILLSVEGGDVFSVSPDGTAKKIAGSSSPMK